MGYIEFLLSSACPPDVGMPLLFLFELCPHQVVDELTMVLWHDLISIHFRISLLLVF
jgi:hypothetical protein